MALYTNIINRHSFNWIWLIKWHHKMECLIYFRESYITKDDFYRQLSVNQINAQIKLTEIWKAYNDDDHPFKLQKNPVNVEERVTRAMTDGLLKSDALTKVTKNTFINDSITAWNKSPMDIKNSTNLHGVKLPLKIL